MQLRQGRVLPVRGVDQRARLVAAPHDLGCANPLDCQAQVALDRRERIPLFVDIGNQRSAIEPDVGQPTKVDLFLPLAPQV